MSLVYSNSWKKYQVIFEVGGCQIGGFPGINPPLLVATVFSLGDKYLVDKKGVVREDELRRDVREAIDIAYEHGLRFGLDVVIPSPESANKLISLTSEFEVPLFIDSPDVKARIHAYRVVRELGLSSLTIANGLYKGMKPEEVEAIRESGIKVAVAMAFDPANPTRTLDPQSRLELVKKELLPLARQAGVEHLLIDAVVLDPASIILSAETIFLVKQKLGLPAGCGPANALGPITRGSVGSDKAIGIHSGATVLLRVFGADFIMYGPPRRIKYIATALSTADALLGYVARYRKCKLPENHPLRKTLRLIQVLFNKANLNR